MARRGQATEVYDHPVVAFLAAAPMMGAIVPEVENVARLPQVMPQ